MKAIRKHGYRLTLLTLTLTLTLEFTLNLIEGLTGHAGKLSAQASTLASTSAQALHLEISFVPGTDLGTSEFYLASEDSTAWADAQKMALEGRTLSVDVTESESGFYTLTSIIAGGQVLTPLYITRGTKSKVLEASLQDGCYVVVTNDPDCGALTKLGHLLGMQTRQLWTSVKTEEQARPLFTAWRELVSQASDWAAQAGVYPELACPELVEGKGMVREYMEVWAYAVNYTGITNLPHILGKKPSEVLLQPSDIMPPAERVMDSQLAVNMHQAAYIIADGLKQLGSLDEKLAALRSRYHTEAIIKKVEQYLKEEDMEHRQLAVGTPLPEGVILEDALGEKKDFKELRGKYVYIDFWASWCVPCCKEVPYLQKLERELNNPEVEFLQVSIDQTREPWLRKMKALNMRGNQWLNATGDICKKLNINSIPHFMLFDKEGRLLIYDADRPSSGEKIMDMLSGLK